MARSYVSAVITAPIAAVWAAVRNFGDLSYFEDAERCELGPGDTGTTIGAVRTVTLNNGASAQERLLGLSDLHHQASYQLLENPDFAFTGYIAELKLTRVVDGDSTLLEWWSDYEVNPQARADVADFIEDGIYRKCIAGLRRSLTA